MNVNPLHRGAHLHLVSLVASDIYRNDAEDRVREWSIHIEAWLLTLKAAGRPDSTVYLRGYQLRRFARAMTGGPWTVTGADVVAWFAGHTWARDTRRSYASGIRGFYQWGQKQGHIAIDPAEDLPSMDPQPACPRPAPRDVYRDSLSKADDRTRLMLQLACELGMRRGEVARAQSDDLERDVRGWTLLVHGKGSKRRRVPVQDTTAATIRRRGPGYLFPGRIDGHLSAAHVGRLVSRVMPGAWTMHTLRHRFATVAYAHDRDVFAVQTLLGHSSADTTRRYVQVPDDALRATAAAVAAAS